MVKTKRSHLIFGIFFCLFLFLVISILVKMKLTSGIDNSVFEFLKNSFPFKKHFLKYLDDLFSPKNDVYISYIVSTIVFIIFSIYKKHDNGVLRGFLVLTMLAGTTTFSYATNILLKPWFARIRPDHTIGFSYPSDHAMLSFSLFITAAYLTSMYITNHHIVLITTILAVFMTLLIGLSRVYLQKHFFTDILGGYLISAVILICMIYLVSLLKIEGWC